MKKIPAIHFSFSGDNLPLQHCVMAILRPKTPCASKSCPAMPDVSECRPTAPGLSRSRPERMDMRDKRVHWDKTCASRHVQIAEATGQ